MIFVIVIVLLIGLVAAVIVGVAKDPGPVPIDIAIGYEHAWQVRDFEILYRLTGPEMHDGLRKADWYAAKRAAYANGSAIGPLVEGIAAEAETMEGDAAVVTTRLTLRDGSVVRNEVRLLRRSRAWDVVAYEALPANAT